VTVLLLLASTSQLVVVPAQVLVLPVLVPVPVVLFCTLTTAALLSLQTAIARRSAISVPPAAYAGAATCCSTHQLLR
jgi:hypothetical protein